MSKKTDPVKKTAPVPPPPQPAPETADPAVKLPPLYRPIDWLTALLTTVVVFVGYFLTLAPDLTLEDSGELAVGSMYACVPHPPGYPVWSIYTWVFTKILPFSNMAWRVAVASAFAGAISSGLLGLMVSRGSSMMIESIGELKSIARRIENLCCVVAGVVAGMLLGFNGFVWSQAVIVEVYSLSNVSLAAVLACLLHYAYNPRQKRYLFLAFFFFGICFTNHQSLLLGAVGVEVAVLAANRKLGRYLFAGNAIFYTLALFAMKFLGAGTSYTSNPALFLVFNTVGVGSFLVWLWYHVRMEALTKWLILAVHALVNVLVYYMWTRMLAKLALQPGDPKVLEGVVQGYVLFLFLFNPVLLVGCYLFSIITGMAEKCFHNVAEWLLFGTVVLLGVLWVFGAAFNLWMPITSMTNPPMNWGYPRTWDGFLHALSRGQYERANPCDFVKDWYRFFGQLLVYLWASMKEFNPVYFAFLVVPFLFFRKMQKRERAWLTGLAAIWGCLGLIMLIMLNPNPDRQTLDLIRVFFTFSYVPVAMLIGYGITIALATLAVSYERYRLVAMGVGAAVVLIALGGTVYTFFSSQYWLMRSVAVFGLVVALLLVGLLGFFRNRAPVGGLLLVTALMPIYPIAANWADNEQRGHLFGYWFGHDMFIPPFTGPDGNLTYDPVLRTEMMKDPVKGKLIYPEMDRDTVLYGGTDPGRFCPTYMIFCESFIKPKDRLNPNFDRRDVYIITQNALADGTYLNYIRAHYNRSAQFQYDLPFFQGGVEAFQTMTLSKEAKLRKLQGEYFEYGTLGKLIGTLDLIAKPLDKFFTELGDRVEGDRRAGSSRFKPADFLDLPGLVAKIQPGASQDELGKFIYERLSKETQGLLAGGNEQSLRASLARDLTTIIEAEMRQIRRVNELIKEQKALMTESATRNKARLDEINAETNRLLSLEMVFTTNKFAGVTLSQHLKLFMNENPQSWSRIRMNRLLLEAAYPKLIAKSEGGLYPDREILTATPEDSQRCFKQYIDDVQRRLDHDRRFPKEPPQIRPGEDVKLTPDGKVQVAGQVAVMTINGLLTKVMFDNNPNHEFYVEESFPLDWMYPHLTPYGIIMKINRQPLRELTDEIVQRDHHFWSEYSKRLIGNWITYDTTVEQIAEFAERVYVRRDYTGFTGDPKFVRDDQAQKAFSKLRSSIAGVYAWRLNDSYQKLIRSQPGPEQVRLQAEYDRMSRETHFAFKQAFAFCAYSPEAVFRYINVLFSQNKYQDALTIAETCLKLDPKNLQVENLVKQLRSQLPAWKDQHATVSNVQSNIARLESSLRTEPNNFSNAFGLVANYLALGQTPQAESVLERIVSNPQADEQVIVSAADAFWKLTNYPKLELALTRLVALDPNSPNGWFDLSAVMIINGRQAEGLAALQKSLTLGNARRATNPGAPNLLEMAKSDPRFNGVRQLPEFQRILTGANTPQPER